MGHNLHSSFCKRCYRYIYIYTLTHDKIFLSPLSYDSGGNIFIFIKLELSVNSALQPTLSFAYLWRLVLDFLNFFGSEHLGKSIGKNCCFQPSLLFNTELALSACLAWALVYCWPLLTSPGSHDSFPFRLWSNQHLWCQGWKSSDWGLHSFQE